MVAADCFMQLSILRCHGKLTCLKMKKGFGIALLAFVLIFLLGMVLFTDTVTISANQREYARGVQTITCTMRNLSLNTVYHGARFTLEQLINGTWKTVDNNRQVMFEVWRKALPPLSSRSIDYHVALFSDLSEPGEYRICVEVEVCGTREIVLCPFTVVE